MYNLITITNNIERLESLAKEALSENFRFVKRTITQWHNGENRFDKPGEILYGILYQDEIVAIGGLNIDPYTDEPNVGRVRHVYVSQKHRQKGLAKLLLHNIIEYGTDEYNYLRLSTNNPNASKLYESLGFYRVDEQKGTHKKKV